MFGPRSLLSPGISLFYGFVWEFRLRPGQDTDQRPIADLVPGLVGKLGVERQLAAGSADLQPGRVLARERRGKRAARQLITGADEGPGVDPFSVLAYERDPVSLAVPQARGCEPDLCAPVMRDQVTPRLHAWRFGERERLHSDCGLHKHG